MCVRIYVCAYICVCIEGGQRVRTALLWQRGNPNVSASEFAIEMVKDMDLPYSFVVR